VKRPTTFIVLALLLLIATALLLRREPREEKPDPPPPAVPAAVAAPPLPPDPPAPAKIVAPKPAAPRRPTPEERQLPTGPVPGWQALKGGSLRGVVKIDGIPNGEDVVDSQGRVRWAFVYLAGGIRDLPPELMAPVLITQDGCSFDPHVFGIRVGQQLDVSATDPQFHRVRFVSSDNRDVSFGRQGGGPVRSRSFRRPEIMVRIACDLHPKSSAWIGVLDHPYFAVTNEAGGYGIADIPPGRYLVKVWHERWTVVEQMVEIPVAGDIRLDFLLISRKS
jgi:hypothetical protein